MKRHVRRFSRKIGRRFDEVRSKFDEARSTFGRSNSDYYYPQRSITVTSTVWIIELQISISFYF
jgi:hypothetical protein